MDFKAGQSYKKYILPIKIRHKPFKSHSNSFLILYLGYIILSFPIQYQFLLQMAPHLFLPLRYDRWGENGVR